jgi:hypothetical protein
LSKARSNADVPRITIIYWTQNVNTSKELWAVVWAGFGVSTTQKYIGISLTFHADIWSDNQEPGYGLFYENGTQKFPFHPRTHC